MNEVEASAKFKRIANIIFLLFLILTLILPPTFAFLFDNYWLLFGIAFSLIGYHAKNRNLKPEKIFFLVTIAIVIYWFNVGFRFSDLITFFWFSYLFGNIFRAFVISYEDLSAKIADTYASNLTSQFMDGSINASGLVSQILKDTKYRQDENEDD